jgi:hypothetical protein
VNDTWVGWTIVGVVAIVGVYLLVSLIEKNAEDTRQRDQIIKTAKIEACKTIPDQGMRTLCIVLGGESGQ